MFRGIYCSNTGLNAMQAKMECIANNTANCNTEGFKQGQISFKPFLEEKYGVMLNQVSRDFRSGALRQTGRQYDFAVEGDGFFQVSTPAGTRYTRNGSFQVNAEGYLTDNHGNKVQGKNGDVRLAEGKLDQELAIAQFKDSQYLVPSELGFEDKGQAGMTPAEGASVQQGYLEGTNTDLLMNMTDMISTARNFALNSRMLMSQDELLQKAAEEVGALK